MKLLSPEISPRLFVINRNRWHKAAENIAGIGFFVFFPGFLMYHLAVATTPFPPLLGGLFGHSAILFAVILPVISSPFFKNYISASPFYIELFFIFIIYVLLWTAAHWFSTGSDEIASASIQSVKTIIIWVAMFYVGMLLPRISIYSNMLYSFLFFFMFISLIVYVALTGQGMFYAKRIFSGEEIASYQVFARSALVVIVFTIVSKRTIAMRSVIILGGLFVLFVLGARSEFAGFLFLSLVLLALFTLRTPRFFLYFLIGMLGVVLSLLFLEGGIQTRQTELMDIASSSSWQARMYLQDIATTQIYRNPVFGVFGGHVLEGGSTSAYSHNVLSAWVSYGAFGFLIYLLLTSIPAVVSFYYVITRLYNDDWLLCFCINCISLVCIVAVKSVFWPLPALGWGLYVRACQQAKPPKQILRESKSCAHG